MITRKGIQRLKTAGRMLGAVLLFALYGLGSTQTGYLHQLFHPDEMAAVHTPADEQDPCHRALYHGVDTGCKHEFHLGKLNSCACFHTLAHSDPWLSDTPVNTIAAARTTCVVHVSEDHSGAYSDFLFLRGPPSAFS